MVLSSALWHRRDLTHGLAHGAISELEPDPRHPHGGLLLDGSVVVADDSGSWSSRHSVVTDRQWQTRSVFVEVLSADGLDRVELAADPLGDWLLDGRDWPELRGCTDVDLGATPLTNVLPLRRLGLAVGEEHGGDAAWLDLPSLAVHRVRQTYLRLPSEPDDPDGSARYRYTDPIYGSFTLTADAAGFVIAYEDLFSRVG